MTEQDDINRIAQEFLHDIAAAYSEAVPDTSRLPFAFLQPHYASIQADNLVEKIILSFECLESDENKETFRKAVAEAASRCAHTWLGINRTFTSIELAYEIARDYLPSDIWERLLQRNAPDDTEMTAIYIERLIPMLRRRGIQADPMKINWPWIIEHIAARALVPTGEWLLRQACIDPQLSVGIFRQIDQRMSSPNFTWYGLSYDDGLDRLLEAFLPGMPASAKKDLLKLAGGLSGATLAFGQGSEDIESQGSFLEGYVMEDFTSPEDAAYDAKQIARSELGESEQNTYEYAY